MTPAPLPSPLLSIVIPTKNRYETLFPTLQAILANIPDERLELVVQDNSDDTAPMRAFLERSADPRIRYAHQEGALSIVENTEAALDRAEGEYVTFIGDDDFVDPTILRFVEGFAARNIDAAIYPPAYYWWKTVTFLNPSRYHQPGAFWYPPSTSAGEQTIDARQELAHLMKEGAASMFDLPRIYHGVVRRSVLAAIKARTGRVVNGASPDMALAVAAAIVLPNYVKVDTPLTVFGASRNSGGGWTAARKHHGKISEQAHLPQSTKDNWSPHLPPIWSEFTIYPQTAMEVMQAMGAPDTLNFPAFYASMLVNEPHLRRYVLPFALRFLARQPQRIPTFLLIAVKKTLGRFRRVFRAHVAGFPFDLSFAESPDDCMKNLATRPHPR